MSIIRLQKHTDKYVILDKTFLEDPSISLKLKGFLAYCLSKPDHWQFHVTQLYETLKEGKDAIYSAIDEGVSHGYIDRIQVKGKDGRFYSTDYLIRELPIKKETPLRDIPDVVNLHVENPTLVRNDPSEERNTNTEPRKADHTLLNDYDESSRSFLKSLQTGKAVLYNLMMKHGPAKITQAIIRAKKWKGAPNKEVAFYTALKAESWNDVDSVDDLLLKNSEHIKTLYEFDGKTISGYRIVIGKNYFEASGGTTVYSFSTLDKEFISKVEEFMKKITKMGKL